MAVLYICGPTASGKSAAALHLARELGGEIVNADAFQLYRGLEILTAAPSPAERGTVPHHLYGILDPAGPIDAAHYRSLALPILADIEQRGKPALVVGGSGLYLKFLTHGPSELPSGDPALRRKLEALPLDELNRRLLVLDPRTAATIDQKNPRYVLRALEICLLSGHPASQLRQSFTADPPDLRGLSLTWTPGELDPRIRSRTIHMLRHGALAEVDSLPAESTTAAKAIGVPEIRAHLAGELTLDACAERIITATRQYAKRQRSWFRREHWLTPLPAPFTEAHLLQTARSLLAD